MTAVPNRVVVGGATLFGLGNLGRAPGTLGSLAGAVFEGLVIWNLPGWAAAVLIVLLLVAGVFICDEAEHRLGLTDPGCIIFDEFSAMPLVYLFVCVPGSFVMKLAVLAAGFALFRFFDILKPLGISRLQVLPGGWGVMVDDVAAAFASCIVLHIGLLVAGRFL